MIKIGSLEHVAVAYRDTDAAAKWYCDVLGFEIALKFNNAGSDINIYFIQDPAGTGFIEIIPMPVGDDSQLSDIPTSHVHLAFNVENMDEAIASLEANGVQIEGPPAKSGENILLFFRDPEGAPLQFVQRAKPLGQSSN